MFSLGFLLCWGLLFSLFFNFHLSPFFFPIFGFQLSNYRHTYYMSWSLCCRPLPLFSHINHTLNSPTFFSANFFFFFEYIFRMKAHINKLTHSFVSKRKSNQKLSVPLQLTIKQLRKEINCHTRQFEVWEKKINAKNVQTKISKILNPPTLSEYICNIIDIIVSKLRILMMISYNTRVKIIVDDLMILSSLCSISWTIYFSIVILLIVWQNVHSQLLSW